MQKYDRDPVDRIGIRDCKTKQITTIQLCKIANLVIEHYKMLTVYIGFLSHTRECDKSVIMNA